MRKLFFFFLLSTLFIASLFSKNDLVIYSYDSLSWIEKKMIPGFEAQNNCRVKLVKFDSTGKMMARLLLEKRKPKADLVIGLNQILLEKAKKEKLITPFKPSNHQKIKKNLLIDQQFYGTPYDYGALAFIYQSDKIARIPQSFNDLFQLKKQIILIDPRTSSTGMDFFLWVLAVYQEQWQDFWTKLKPAILTITPGWSEAFAKFEAGEAPMMLSYCTDGAYSYHYYQDYKYKIFIPEEGGYFQREMVALVKNKKRNILAKRFIEFMLEDDFQKEIPLNQWMFPVTHVKLPDVFQYAVIPQKSVTLTDQKLIDKIDQLLEKWENLIQ